MANARKIAVSALMRVNNDTAYSNIALNEILNSANPEVNDRALATALFYGVLDTKITLDYILKKLTGKTVTKIKPYTLECLRIGLYQLIFTDNIPASAAVNESVKLVKSSKEAYNSGFCNAVLRNYIRNPIKLPADNSVFALSVRYSCPEWIITELINDYDLNTVIDYLEQSVLSPPLVLRVNTLKNSAEELSDTLKQNGRDNEILSEMAVRITEGGFNTENFEPYKQGLFYVQDLSSQRCAAVLMPRAKERVLDLCAAPGGKSFSLALLMENKGEIVSCDIHPHRTELIKKGAERLGINIIKPMVNDATKFNSQLGLFDAVLCDVPCSGLGIIRRKPDIKYKNEHDFIELEAVQLKILETAVNYLKPNGRLVYSTCTVRKAENERIVEKFLENNKEFKLEKVKTYMPKKDGGDGFFTALILRK